MAINNNFHHLSLDQKMSGIYLHIPFCKKACHYCDFHFSTSLRYVEDMVDAICNELTLKATRLDLPVESIYFGGGTPSLLTLAHFERIFHTIFTNYNVHSTAEITIECNPDDLYKQKLVELRQLPVNRFSIGIQSFFDEDLRWMNRAHTADEAESSVKRAQDSGFDNITVDLIYGYPLLSDLKWQRNIKNAMALQVPHISAYSLTVENRTALAAAIRRGAQMPMDDEQSAEQFTMLMSDLTENGFEHYEISNFARNKKYAIHNTNYWKGIPYLGIGPSAHGFTGEIRTMNIANNAQYLEKIGRGIIPETIEKLTENDRFNEYMMVSLRTMWGIDLEKVKADFPAEFYQALIQESRSFIDNQWISEKDNYMVLTTTGKLYADKIASDLFRVGGTD